MPHYRPLTLRIIMQYYVYINTITWYLLHICDFIKIHTSKRVPCLSANVRQTPILSYLRTELSFIVFLFIWPCFMMIPIILMSIKLRVELSQLYNVTQDSLRFVMISISTKWVHKLNANLIDLLNNIII